MVGTLKPRWSVMFPRPLDVVSRDMDELVGQFFGNGNGHGHAGVPAPAALWEEEGRWCVEVDLPGVAQDDIEVTFEKNVLTIAAERKVPEDRKPRHEERAYGKFQRQISLPESVDSNSIEAELKDGVLHLALAKRPETQPKKIAIKAS
jgi:HSP20 family protein